MISGKERNIVFKNLIHDFRKSESDFDIMEKLFKNKREESFNLLEELSDPNEWDQEQQSAQLAFLIRQTYTFVVSLKALKSDEILVPNMENILGKLDDFRSEIENEHYNLEKI